MIINNSLVQASLSNRLLTHKNLNSSYKEAYRKEKRSNLIRTKVIIKYYLKNSIDANIVPPTLTEKMSVRSRQHKQSLPRWWRPTVGSFSFIPPYIFTTPFFFYYFHHSPLSLPLSPSLFLTPSLSLAKHENFVSELRPRRWPRDSPRGPDPRRNDRLQQAKVVAKHEILDDEAAFRQGGGLRIRRPRRRDSVLARSHRSPPHPSTNPLRSHR